MKHKITNGTLSIIVDEKGAELKSIVRVDRQQEILWQGDAKYWEGQSPVLFPTVGRSFQDTIHYQGKSWPMPKHGIVHDAPFTLIGKTADSLTFCLESNEETLLNYPFHFRFAVRYQLVNETLKVTFIVVNLSNESALHYIVGGHPGIQYPDFCESDDVHGYLGFNVKDKLTSLGLKPGGYAWEEGTFDVQLDGDGLLPLTNHTFDCDTLLDATSRVRTCVLYNKVKRPVVTVEFDTPVLALWSPCGRKAPFVCIEPWKGLQDADGYCEDFANRPLMNHVEAGKAEETTYSITVH